MTMTIKNKITTSLFLGVILSFVGLNAANAIAGEHRGQNRGGIGQADTNGDGMIDLAEMIASATLKVEGKFTQKDTDQDNFITFEEFTASGKAASDLSEYAIEIVQCVIDLKEELGSDTIQVPSVDDFLSPQQKFDLVDSNVDGLIELTEAIDRATTKATDKFNERDLDNDGFITVEEKQAFADAHKGTRHAIRHCINEVTDDSVDDIV